MGLASVPNAEQNCMRASSAPTLPQASGLSAARLFRNASPTSALAMTAPSFRFVPPLSAKRRRHQGALTTRVAPSTISSRSSTSTTPSLPTPRPHTQNDSLYLSACSTILLFIKHRGLIDRRFRGPYETGCQRGSSGLFTCKARTVARATEPAFRKAGHHRRRS